MPTSSGASILPIVAVHQQGGDHLFQPLLYVMTGLHGLHVFIGVGLVSGLLVLTARGVIHPQDFIKLENGGL